MIADSHDWPSWVSAPHKWTGGESSPLSSCDWPQKKQLRKILSPDKKKNKITIKGSCLNSGTSEPSVLPASAEGICSLFPGAVPRSGQTHCCHHPSRSSPSPRHCTDTSLSTHNTSSHGLTCLPDVCSSSRMFATLCCLSWAASPSLFWTVCRKF